MQGRNNKVLRTGPLGDLVSEDGRTKRGLWRRQRKTDGRGRRRARAS